MAELHSGLGLLPCGSAGSDHFSTGADEVAAGLFSRRIDVGPGTRAGTISLEASGREIGSGGNGPVSRKPNHTSQRPEQIRIR